MASFYSILLFFLFSFLNPNLHLFFVFIVLLRVIFIFCVVSPTKSRPGIRMIIGFFENSSTNRNIFFVEHVCGINTIAPSPIPNFKKKLLKKIHYSKTKTITYINNSEILKKCFFFQCQLIWVQIVNFTNCSKLNKKMVDTVKLLRQNVSFFLHRSEKFEYLQINFNNYSKFKSNWLLFVFGLLIFLFFVKISVFRGQNLDFVQFFSVLR